MAPEDMAPEDIAPLEAMAPDVFMAFLAAVLWRMGLGCMGLAAMLDDMASALIGALDIWAKAVVDAANAAVAATQATSRQAVLGLKFMAGPFRQGRAPELTRGVAALGSRAARKRVQLWAAARIGPAPAVWTSTASRQAAPAGGVR
jgi:hypothetical protein